MCDVYKLKDQTISNCFENGFGYKSWELWENKTERYGYKGGDY